MYNSVYINSALGIVQLKVCGVTKAVDSTMYWVHSSWDYLSLILLTVFCVDSTDNGPLDRIVGYPKLKVVISNRWEEQKSGRRFIVKKLVY